jgi:hypothetical protein
VAVLASRRRAQLAHRDDLAAAPLSVSSPRLCARDSTSRR